MSNDRLSVVMPAYNEAGAIEEVVTSWVEALDALAVDYEIRVYDDGSTDATPEILLRLVAATPRLQVVRQSNRGHGPTLLRAYREATGEWVFHTDADGEIGADDLAGIWTVRDGEDLVIGYRRERRSGPARALISSLARGTVRVAYGGSLRDVNCPYRLIRRQRLQEALEWLPKRTFAPNVAVAGFALRAGWKITEVAVQSRPRLAGRSSLGPLNLTRGTLLAGIQTLAIARRSRLSRPVNRG